MKCLHAIVLLTALTSASTSCKRGETDAEKAQAAKLKTSQAQWAKDDAALVVRVEAKLAYVESLRGKLAASTAKDGVALDKADWNEALWVHEQDLANLVAEPKGPRVEDASKIRLCAKETRSPDFGKRTASTMKKCDKVRYVFVVRTIARTEPKVTAAAAKFENGKFAPGVATGDVLAYDVRDKKHIGGYRWRAQNDDTVRGPEMTKNFEDNILKEIQRNYHTMVTHP